MKKISPMTSYHSDSEFSKDFVTALCDHPRLRKWNLRPTTMSQCGGKDDFEKYLQNIISKSIKA